MSHKENSELEQLIAKSLDRQLTENESVRLQALLKGNAEYRAEYIRQTTMHALLIWREGQVGNTAEPSDFTGVDGKILAEMLDEIEHASLREEASAMNHESPNITLPFEDRNESSKGYRSKNKTGFLRSRFTEIVAVAVVLALISLIVWFDAIPATSTPSSSGATFATVEDSVDVVWGDTNSGPQNGARFRADKTYDLRSGVLKIRFDGGASAIVDAPAVFSIESEQAAKLTLGKLVGHVPDHAKGLTINTPMASVIDLGTEFGVSVDTNQVSDVYVLAGAVSLGVTLTDNGSSPMTVERYAAGDAVRVDGSGSVNRIPFKDDQFWRQLPKVVYETQTILATHDARLIDKNGDDIGDVVQFLDEPYPGNVVNDPEATQLRIGVGERNGANHADEDERRYWVAFELTKEQQVMMATAESVHLGLTLSNVAFAADRSVAVHGIADPANALPTKAGYHMPGPELVERAFEKSTPVDVRQQFEVTEFSLSQVAGGRGIVAFRLQVEQEVPNNDKKHNTFVFWTVQSPEETKPTLQMKVRRYSRDAAP